ncbi:hypothetical protein PHMEG_00021032 [Phytophthora megakarya]|uniref:Uncharacterized protein n=1 Tax=Phytophthora megakarya TaxID=4795 RepID=A0A225VMX4_9STRA|nr:hypothetical protein PHMEG_00021032 [Phytophthora megakarya]
MEACFKTHSRLYIYVCKVTATTTIRRATEGCIAAATALIDGHLNALPADEQLRDVSRAYWAVCHARQPEQILLSMPTNPTFTQLRRIDALQREMDLETPVTGSNPAVNVENADHMSGTSME